jgi:hypothetical protein
MSWTERPLKNHYYVGQGSNADRVIPIPKRRYGVRQVGAKVTRYAGKGMRGRTLCGDNGVSMEKMGRVVGTTAVHT